MKRFVSLDSFRGIAAVGIVGVHLGFFVRPAWIPAPEDLYLLVDFFFVLSGFVISYSYLDRIKSKADMGQFLLRRIGRVWPLHAVMMGVLLLAEILKFAVSASGVATLNAFGEAARPDYFVQHFLLLNSFGLTSGHSWNVPSWSISAELVSYLAFAIVAWLAVPFWAASVALCLAGLAALLLWSPLAMAVTYDYGAFRCLMGFFAGCLALSIYRTTAIGRIRSVLVSTSLEIVALAVSLIFLAVADVSWLSYAAPIVFAFCVLAYSSDAGLVSRFLHSKPFVYLGLISYSVYMVHYVLLVLLEAAVRVLQRVMPDLLNVQFPFRDDILALAFVGLVVAAASVTHRFIEVPGQRLFRRLEAAPKPKAYAS